MKHSTIIVQLARIGDLAQCYPLILDVKRQDGYMPALIVDKRCSDLAELIVGKENVYTLPVDEIKESIVEVSGSYKFLYGIVSELWENISAERAINLNYFEPAAIIAEGLKVTSRLGIRWRECANKDWWSEPVGELLRSNAGLRSGKRHLSDIWRDFVSPKDSSWVGLTVTPEIAYLADSIVHHNNINTLNKNVVLVTDSGNTKRRWSPENWIEMMERLDSNSNIILIGNQREDLNVDYLLLKNSNIHDLRNKTTLKEMISILSIADLVIGVDTGPLHIAAMMNTPTLGLYFGSMNYLETGAYSEKSTIITTESRLFPSFEDDLEKIDQKSATSIAPDAVIGIANSIIQETAITSNSSCAFKSYIDSNGINWDNVDANKFNFDEAISYKSNIQASLASNEQR